MAESVEFANLLIERCRSEVSKRIVGQDGMIKGLLVGLIAGGHILLEGIPGLAKTMAIRTLAEVVDLGFKRIQFTPDLLPADLVGTMIYRQETGQFIPKKGPLFSNIILADEINRAPAKVQSALLEAMQEGQITLGEESYPLPKPFFVLGTQNPIEHEGTYPLPEAQLDRFLMKIMIEYPSPEEELKILKEMGGDEDLPVKKVLTDKELSSLRESVGGIRVEERILRYIISLISASRERDRIMCPFAKFIDFGASPRGSLGILKCARVVALIHGRDYVLPDDVKEVIHPVLRHRVVLSYEAESEQLSADDVIDQILNAVPVP